MKTKTITITKGFLWVEARREFEVKESRKFHRESYIEVERTGKRRGTLLSIYLSEIEGGYEWVTWKPEKGERYYFISTRGVIVPTYWQNSSYDIGLLEWGNIFPYTDEGKAEADAMIEKMIQLFKEEI